MKKRYFLALISALCLSAAPVFAAGTSDAYVVVQGINKTSVKNVGLFLNVDGVSIVGTGYDGKPFTVSFRKWESQLEGDAFECTPLEVGVMRGNMTYVAQLEQAVDGKLFCTLKPNA
jgi:hypothetical protein